MEPSLPTSDQVSFEALRQHRADLRESMSILEKALAEPAPGRRAAWAERVRAAAMGLSVDFREHVQLTEGDGGLYRGLLATAPRLSNAVARLTREHAQIGPLVDNLVRCVERPEVCDVDPVRDIGTELLGKLVRHRQRGSDLVYEAYEVDIGGET